MDQHGEDQAGRLKEDVPLAADDLLAAVVGVRSLFPVVLPVWLSMMTAEGCRGRHSAARRSPRDPAMS